MRIKSNKIGDILDFYRVGLISLYPAFEAESLFFWAAEEILKKNKVQIKQSFEDGVNESTLLKFKFTYNDLLKGIPIQYIFNKAYFYGLSFYVDSNVLIPRPETEELISWVLEKKQSSENLQIMDLCSGSGCIAITLAKNLPQSKVSAVEISQNAIEIAKKNAAENATSINWIQADLLNFSFHFPKKFDIICSNPPYVTLSQKKEMHINVLNHEPSLALFVSDENALIFYKSIAHFAKKHLSAQGSIFIEINEELFQECSSLFKKEGFEHIELRQDMQNKWRMAKIKFSASPF